MAHGIWDSRQSDDGTGSRELKFQHGRGGGAHEVPSLVEELQGSVDCYQRDRQFTSDAAPGRLPVLQRMLLLCCTSWQH